MYEEYTYVSWFNFKLGGASAAIGKGFTGFSAYAEIPISTYYGPSIINQPGSDMGCYQTNGSGNTH
jgi:hypothetical protein